MKMLKYFLSQMPLRVKNVMTMKKLTCDCLETIDLKYNSKTNKPVRGLSTGFRLLDLKDGLGGGELIIVGGRPSMGKTAFVSGIAQHISIAEKLPVLYFSLDLTKEALTERLLSTSAQVDLHKVRTGFLNQTEWSRLKVSAATLSEAPLFIDDSLGLGIDELHVRACKFKRQENIELIIIDSLQSLYGSAKSGHSKDEAMKTCQALKKLAEDLGVPILLTSQLSQEADFRDGHKPKLRDLLEWGDVGRYADTILLIFREEYYNPTDKNQYHAEIIVAKNRKRSAGVFPLMFLGEFMKFQDMSKEAEDMYYSDIMEAL